VRPLIVKSYPTGRRVWVFGQRVHHGATGCALIAAGVSARSLSLVAVGVALVIHDRRDWRVWVAREGLAAAH
jgi:hypothetical protein